MPHLYRVILPVSDIERAQRFYAAVLGTDTAARAAAVFVARAVVVGFDLDAGAHEKRADALRAVQFVTRDGQKVHAELADVGFDFPA